MTTMTRIMIQTAVLFFSLRLVLLLSSLSETNRLTGLFQNQGFWLVDDGALWPVPGDDIAGAAAAAVVVVVVAAVVAVIHLK